MQNATIETNLIAVEPTTDESGHKWLKIQVPNGWDDCKKLTKKVLKYNGETYVWRSWNSDYNYCYFIQSNDIAEFVKKLAKRG